MADVTRVADDRFRIYYQEKLWELIPAIYRFEDGREDNPNPNTLRALIEVIAEQAAILRRSQDRLWEDQFIELCNDWAVPYIGDLLGTRLLSSRNPRGRRVDVAKTIYYRRRKGTPRILEEIMYDISGWDGKMVEGFQRLVRSRHGLDPVPASYAGPLSGTLPGGIADLRFQAASELADGPFEEYFHAPDFRKPKGLDGRYGISKLNFYLYRLQSYWVEDVTPVLNAGSTDFLFDPSGRDIPLFSKRKRPTNNEWEAWHSAMEWEVPAPIRCRLLGEEAYVILEAHIQAVVPALATTDKDILKTLIGVRFRNEAELRQRVTTLSDPQFQSLLALTLVADCGKSQLIPDSLYVVADTVSGIILKDKIAAGSLEAWTVPALKKDVVIDAELGRFKLLTAPADIKEVTAAYHYGFAGPIGAGTYDRKEVERSKPTALVQFPAFVAIDPSFYNPIETIEIQDNRTYEIKNTSFPVIQKLVIQAANQRRPYLLLDQDLVITGAGHDATLVLDGLWLGSKTPGWSVILKGQFESVIIRNCTLDPGNGTSIKSVGLLIDATVKNICIQASITGPVATASKSLDEDRVTIIDSIIQSTMPTVLALEVLTGITVMERVTVLGAFSVHRLQASELLATDSSHVTDTQAGCFRFSAAPNTSRLPRPYESFLFSVSDASWFGSRDFGKPTYGQLSDTAPAKLYRGGENGAEMGAFNSLLNAIKEDGILTKVEEYMPFGLIPAFIHKT